MSTQLHDLQRQTVLGTSVFPEVVEDSTNGQQIDLIAGDGPCFAIQSIGGVGGTSPSLTGKIQESSDAITWTDIPGASFTAVTASDNSQIITFQRTKRYLRHYRTVTGTNPSFVLQVTIGQQKKTA